MKADFKSDFSKTQNRLPKTQEREVENGSFLKQCVLTRKIGERQPIFFAVLKFIVEVPFGKWISRES